MARKDVVKETLLSLLNGAEPAISEDILSLGKMQIHCTESGYANISVSRSLDIPFIKEFFEGMDVYAEASQASVRIKKNANIFLYGEPNNAQRVAFGPVMDHSLLILVFKYIRAILERPA